MALSTVIDSFGSGVASARYTLQSTKEYLTASEAALAGADDQQREAVVVVVPLGARWRRKFCDG